MDHPQGVLRTGDRATVKFEFISHPEFIKVGMKLLFREGKTKVSDMSASHRSYAYLIYDRALVLSRSCCNVFNCCYSNSNVSIMYSPPCGAGSNKFRY
jgi:hypothetical protein